MIRETRRKHQHTLSEMTIWSSIDSRVVIGTPAALTRRHASAMRWPGPHWYYDLDESCVARYASFPDCPAPMPTTTTPARRRANHSQAGHPLLRPGRWSRLPTAAGYD